MVENMTTMIQLSEVPEHCTQTYRVWVAKHPQLEQIRDLCHQAKNLWNRAQYLVRQEFFARQRTREGGNGGVHSLKYLDAMLKVEDVYIQLPKRVAQGVLSRVSKSWRGYFRSIQKYYDDPEKFLGRPGIPGYQPKEGLYDVYFYKTSLNYDVQRQLLTLMPRKLGLQFIVPNWDHELAIESVIINPKPDYGGYFLNIHYNAEIASPPGSNKMAIDIGVNNFVTFVTTTGDRPLTVSGGPLKSINHLYNKRLAKIKSCYSGQGRSTGPALQGLGKWRFFKVQDFLHKLTHRLVGYAVGKQIDVIIVGLNREWKQASTMGKKGNQKFQYMPHARFIELLTSKAALQGIQVIVIEEDYTSQSSFLDDDPLPFCGEKPPKFSGERLVSKKGRRGRYQTKHGRIINADVNAAYNILRRVYPKLAEAVRQTILQGSVYLLHPHSWRFRYSQPKG